MKKDLYSANPVIPTKRISAVPLQRPSQIFIFYFIATSNPVAAATTERNQGIQTSSAKGQAQPSMLADSRACASAAK